MLSHGVRADEIDSRYSDWMNRWEEIPGTPSIQRIDDLVVAEQKVLFAICQAGGFLGLGAILSTALERTGQNRAWTSEQARAEEVARVQIL
jgi:hypothetical protein